MPIATQLIGALKMQTKNNLKCFSCKEKSKEVIKIKGAIADSLDKSLKDKNLCFSCIYKFWLKNSDG